MNLGPRKGGRLWRQKFLRGWRPILCPTMKSRWLMAVPVAAVATAVAKGFNYWQETKLRGRGEPENRESTGYNGFVLYSGDRA